MQGFPCSPVGKELPAVQETRLRFLDQKDPLEKEMVTHSSILPGESRGQRGLECHTPWGRKSQTRLSD